MTSASLAAYSISYHVFLGHALKMNGARVRPEEYVYIL
jgi:hypothetical protein